MTLCLYWQLIFRFLGIIYWPYFLEIIIFPKFLKLQIVPLIFRNYKLTGDFVTHPRMIVVPFLYPVSFFFTILLLLFFYIIL